MSIDNDKDTLKQPSLVDKLSQLAESAYQLHNQSSNDPVDQKRDESFRFCYDLFLKRIALLTASGQLPPTELNPLIEMLNELAEKEGLPLFLKTGDQYTDSIGNLQQILVIDFPENLSSQKYPGRMIWPGANFWANSPETGSQFLPVSYIIKKG